MAFKVKRTKIRGRRYGRRRYGHKKHTKGYAGSYPSALVVSRGLGFPARFKCKLRYTEQNGLSSTGSLTTASYSANGLYDPYLGVGGHQPMYFDQMMAIYNKYKVLGSKITVVVNNLATMEPGYFTVYLDDDGTASATSMNQIVELGKVKQVYSLGGIHTAFTKFTSNYSARKMFKDKFTSDSLIGDAASNPSEIAAYVVAYQNHAGFTTAQSPVFQVTIDYFVEFFELKETTQS